MTSLKTDLSLHGPCYTGSLTCLEVQPFDPEVHTDPGLYLQHVEGCGYTVYHLTCEEAEQLVAHLLRGVTETRKAFAATPKPC